VTSVDPAKIAAEAKWLSEHPDFLERPATIEEFLGPDYLNIRERMRERIVDELVTIIGDEVDGERITKYPLAMITGGIGIGKTTVASVVLPYLVHWCLCLKDPQGFFGLLPGTRIAFMQMSTSEGQALEVVFGDIKARMEHSPWFKNHPTDPKFKNQIRFPDKDIWIIPGDSAETTFEGYNILGGILDEADSHKVTENKDYADQGYDTISNRISSRFQDRGFLLVIGQMKSATGFASRKFREFSGRDDAHAVRLTIWEAMGKDFYRDKVTGEYETFHYDTKRKQIVPSGVAGLLSSESILEIPKVYEKEFVNNPEKALKDLAGVPPVVGDPFISLVFKIEEAIERWEKSHDGLPNPCNEKGVFERWFTARDSVPRVAHLDIAYSAEGDALGLAMGHVKGVVDIDGEMKPYIVIDFVMRLKAPAGGEIFLADVRHKIYALKNDMKFKLKKVTMDGFQSTDTEQQLRKRRYDTEYVSVDKDLLPYYDLREAIYEDRIEIPPLWVSLRPGESEKVNIPAKELSELVDNGKKIDHPEGGSKDVADCLAGITFTLMGDRSYRRKVTRLDAYRQQERVAAAVGGIQHPALRGPGTMSAPVPPSLIDWRNQS
jgi:hypothetical protein